MGKSSFRLTLKAGLIFFLVVTAALLFAERREYAAGRQISRVFSSLFASPVAAPVTLFKLQFENNLTATNGQVTTRTIVATYAKGIVGQAAFLDRGGNVTYPSASYINPLEGTIEAWIKPNWAGTDGLSHAIFAFGASGGMYLGKDGNNMRFVMNRSVGTSGIELDVMSDITSWQTGQWHHVAATWSNTGKYIRLYIDGTLASERTLGSSLPTISTTLYPTLQVGGDTGRANLTGYIDEFSIIDTPLTTRQIVSDMMSPLSISAATLTLTNSPSSTTNVITNPISTVNLFPGWYFWKTFKYTATHTDSTIGTLTLPFEAATVTSSNTSSGVAVDDHTGRIFASSSATGSTNLTAVLNSGATVIATDNIPVTVGAFSSLPTDTNVSITSPLDTPASGYTYLVPVAVIRFLPTTDGTNLDTSVTGTIPGAGSNLLSSVGAYLTSVEKKIKYSLEEGSRFRGYGGGPTPSLGYQVVKIINVYEPIPLGQPSSTSGKYFPDYNQIFNRFGLGSLVSSLGVKEVWLEQYTNTNLDISEANMSSPVSGDISSSSRANDDLPVFSKSYTVYSLDITKGEAEAVRYHGHQLESIFTFLDERYNGNDALFLDGFTGRNADGITNPYRCGKTNRPPNATTDFVFNSLTAVQSDIDSWIPDGIGTQKAVNSDTWTNIAYVWPSGTTPTDKSQSQWYIYWMQSLPGRNNGIAYFGADRLTNWWQFIGDWDGSISASLALTESATCTYTLSSANAIHYASGGQGSFGVTCDTTCKWAASTTASWITLNSSTGTGPGTVSYTVSPTTTSRTGTITVAGQTFTVTQDNLTCSFTVQSSLSLGSSLSTGTIAVTADPSNSNACGWVGSSNASWITVSPTTTVTGTGNLSYTAQANTGPARTGTLTVAGTTITVNQASGCSFTFSPSTQNISATASTQSVALNASSTACPWSISSDAAWITITTATSGTGTTTVSYSVTDNTTTSTRTGHITVASGPTLTINQSAGNPVPTLTTLSPLAVTSGSAAFTLTVTGTNFVNGSIVRWNGSSRTTSFVSSTTLNASILASDITSGGTAAVTVFTPTPGGGTSSPVTFTINNPTPVITSLNPTNALVNGSAFTLTVNGTSFVSGATVSWNGSSKPTTFVNSSQLTASISAADLLTSGTAFVVVNNPSPVSSPSNTMSFTVNNPVPSLVTISPTTAVAGTGQFTLTVNGSSFVSGSVVRWNGSDRVTQFISSGQLTATINASDIASSGTAAVTVFNPTPGGGTSGQGSFSITNPSPSITTLSPSSTQAGSSTFTLTVNGSNFVNGSTVRWNGNTRTTTFINASQLTASISASDIATAGTASISVSNPAPGGGTSANSTFSINNPTPTLTAINPVSANAGSGTLTLTVTGTNFVSGCVVKWNGSDRTTAFISSTQVSATITVGDLATAGTASIVVSNPTPGGGSSNTSTFTINNPAPTLSTISPLTGTTGGASFTLTITGSNFVSGSTVRWNGSDRTTTYVSPTQLTAAIPSSDLASSGQFPVSVSNPAPGGGISNSQNFSVNNPVPTVSGLSPSSATAGAAGFTLTVNGTNFVSGCVVRWNGSDRTTTFVSSSQVTALINASDIAAGGTSAVTVFNPSPGGGLSGSSSFTVSNPAPSLTTLSPNSASTGAASFQMTVTGSNFVNGSVVRLNGTDHTTVFVSSTQLTATVTSGDVAVPGTAQVTVFNPAPNGGTSNSLPFTINTTSATLSNISPSSATAGSAGFTLTVNGSGFPSGSTVRWNGSDRTTSFVSSSQLTAAITAADIATAGTATITVNSSIAVSGSATFTINNPAPAISGLNPSSTFAAGSAFTLTVTGSNFVTGSTVRWNGSDRTTTFVNSTTLNAAITAADILSAGTANVTVNTPSPGGGGTSASVFTINAACAYSINPTTQTFTSSGGSGSITMTAGTGCAWTASTADSWITLTNPVSGSGNGTIAFNVAANSGSQRTGTITVAGKTFTVSQSAPSTTCVATRTLPASFTSGVAFAVSISASPGPSTQIYAVEEIIPSGWTVSGIDNGGTFDSVNGKVKWGPFFDASARTLNYTVTPSLASTTTQTFSGAVSVDGVNNSICGNTSVTFVASFHPADTGNDFRIDINELTAYGVAWKTGATWPRPPSPIDINYLTNAGLIWKLGETYHYDSTKTPPFAAGASSASLFGVVPGLNLAAPFLAPVTNTVSAGLLALVSGNESLADPLSPDGSSPVSSSSYINAPAFGGSQPDMALSGSAISSLSSATFTPGTGITVTISVTPDPSTNVYALEDVPPAGWTVSAISGGGAYDATNKKVKWGPFFDNSARTVSYIATPPSGDSGNKLFIGSASFDGVSVAVTGGRSVSSPTTCSWSISPGSQAVGSVGGTTNVNVIAGTGCTWSASSNAAWLTISSGGTGSGNGTVGITIGTNNGAQRSGTVAIAGQTFTVTQAANAAPTITVANGISRQLGAAATADTIATVTDAETSAGNLTVSVLSAPAGVTVSDIVNNGGTVSANISVSCNSGTGTKSIQLQVMDSAGATSSATLTINATGNTACNITTPEANAGDQRLGSVLLFGYYTSTLTTGQRLDTQLRLTNANDTTDATVRLFLVDGQSNAVASFFLCLPAGQTTVLQMGDIDPGVSGYAVAVAVDRTSGCPVSFNGLTGSSVVKYSNGMRSSFSALAIAALTSSPAACPSGSSSATISFDGISYGRLPGTLLVDSLGSIKDGNDMRLVVNRIGGSLISGVGALGTVSGQVRSASRVMQSFSFSGNNSQAVNNISSSFPRISPRMDQFIPAGQNGWLKLWTDGGYGIFGILMNNPANSNSATFLGGSNLQVGGFAPSVSLEIPVDVPVC